jgi:hypothetical protein
MFLVLECDAVFAPTWLLCRGQVQATRFVCRPVSLLAHGSARACRVARRLQALQDTHSAALKAKDVHDAEMQMAHESLSAQLAASERVLCVAYLCAVCFGAYG